MTSCNICVGCCDAGLGWVELTQKSGQIDIVGVQPEISWLSGGEEFSALTSAGARGYCPSHAPNRCQCDGIMSHVANEVPNPGIVVSAIIRRKRKFVTNAKNFWVSFLLAALLTAASAAGGSTGWAAAGWRQTGGRARAPPATHCPAWARLSGASALNRNQKLS